MADSILRHKQHECYVYEILVDGLVRYVGKGTGDRAASHISMAKGVVRRRAAGDVVRTQRFYNKLAKAITSGSTVEYRIRLGGLSAQDAFSAEIESIRSFPHGQLWNDLPGGQGADSEHFKRLWASPEGRARNMAALMKPEVVERRKRNVAIQWADESARERNRRHVTEQWKDPEFRAERTEAIRKSFSQEVRDRISARTKERWADPDAKAKRLEAIWSDSGNRSRHRAGIIRMWEDEANRAKHKASIKKMWANDALRARHKTSVIRIWKDDALRERHRAAVIQRWSDDKTKTKHKDAAVKLWADESYIAKHKDAIIKMWADESYRAKHRAGVIKAWAKRKAKNLP